MLSFDSPVPYIELSSMRTYVPLLVSGTVTFNRILLFLIESTISSGGRSAPVFQGLFFQYVARSLLLLVVRSDTVSSAEATSAFRPDYTVN